MKLFKLVLQAASGIFLSLLACMGAAQEASYPGRPIRVVVPLGPGSGMDSTTRLIAKNLSATLGKPVYVENKPGADTAIGTRDVTTSAADGYTLLSLSGATLTINPLVVEKMQYNPGDIRLLGGISRGGAVLVTAQNSRFQSLAALMAAARQAPGSVTLASYGQVYRLGGLRLEKLAGVRFNDIPYKSPAVAVNDVLSGQVDATFLEFGTARALVQSGRVRALAVTHAQRHPGMPDVATIAEQGYPGFSLYVWLGFGVHAKTPEPIVAALEAALADARQSREFTELSETRGTDIFPQDGKQLAATVEQELAMNRILLKSVTGK